MVHKHDIICEQELSKDIYFKITTYLVPALFKNSKVLHLPKITAKTTNKILSCKNEVGTGCSCGVDSFYAILSNINHMFDDYKLTCLCINNVGAFNECYSEDINSVLDNCYNRARKVASAFNIPIMETNSNFTYLFEQPHAFTHTFSSMLAVLILQKFWGKYFYSSAGSGASAYSISDAEGNDSSNYEVLSLNCFSTQNTKIFSQGFAETRLDKIKAIADNKIVQENLHVCISKSNNCGKCLKCRRTMLMLYAIGKLELLKDVFDIDYFYTHKEEYYETPTNDNFNPVSGEFEGKNKDDSNVLSSSPQSVEIKNDRKDNFALQSIFGGRGGI